MSSKLTAALGVFAMVAFAAGPVHAQGKCQGAKLKAAGKDASCLLALDGKVAGGKPANPIKTQACKDKMSNSFTSAESKPPCGTTGDAAAIQADVDSFTNAVNAALSKGVPNKCQAAKMKAAGKKASALLSCQSKAAAKSLPVDPACVAKAVGKFNAAFTKAESKPPCGTTGDNGSIESIVDDFSDLLACELQASPACNCGPNGSPTPSFLGFTTSVGAGNCGDVLDDSAATAATLACSTLYIGGAGAGAVPPGVVPDYGTSQFRNKCCTGKHVFLAASTSAQTGSIKNCTSTGCFFGAPLPIVNPTTPPLSTCVINKVATNATGNAMCDAGSMDIDMPLSSVIYLIGDSLPKRCGPTAPNPGGKCTTNLDCAPDTCNDDSAAIQPCPICNPSTLRCNGGANEGMACQPGTLLASGDPYPTSHDCPPMANPLATLSIPYALTTGLATKTSVDLPGQTHVFCGFCGSPSSPTFSNPPLPCASDADCAAAPANCGAGTSPCTTCKQRNPGAFMVGPARTIDENGIAGGDLATGPKSVTMGGVFCIPPTYIAGGLIDSNADLPGPGAVGLPGTLSLIP
jgi:hypothetical protein